MARPTKYTSEIIKRILAALEAGYSEDSACRLYDVSVSSLRRWKRRNSGFAESLEIAKGKARLHFETIFTTAAEKYPKYALLWLERRYPEEWGKDTPRRGDTEEISALLLSLFPLSAESGEEAP